MTNVAIGSVIGIEYKTDEKSGRKLIYLQCLVNEEDDIQTCLWYSPCGSTSIPLIDSNVVIVSITDAFRIAIACDDGIDPDEYEEGERVTVSYDSEGVRRTEIQQTGDGTLLLHSVDADENETASVKIDNTEVIINNGEDWAVQYTELKSAFDQLRSDLNSMISAWNTFASAYVPGGPLAVGTPPNASSASSSSADMSGAKIETVRVP